jgi:hypothetical protein
LIREPRKIHRVDADGTGEGRGNQLALQSAVPAGPNKPYERRGSMKHTFSALAIASLVGISPLYAAPPLPQAAAQTRPATGTTSVMNADFVAYDAKTKNITVKDEKGQTSSVLLEGRAVREIGQLHLKNGDHVMLTYRNNANGEHKAVTDIKPAKAKA